MKKLLFLILIVFLGRLQTVAQLTTLVAKNEKAIFQVFSYDEFGSPFSTGTGFFINSNGTALTNLHVLKEAKFAFIRDFKGNIYQIDKITRICKDCDIAEFTVTTKTLTTFAALTLTTTIPPKASDIFVIGNPEGFESTVSKGIISSIREQDNSKVIQITAPISPGSSGSPIMDMDGKVIGIATFQYKEGQNLNFGYWIGCKENLTANKEFILSNDATNNLYVVNKVCKGENNLILNSIEVNEKNTVLNLSFTNTSLSFGDRAFIFASIGDKEKSFFIEDKITKNKIYLYDATIGSSAKDPTFLNLGETKQFKLFFPAITNWQEINISEGMTGSDWSFPDVKLSDYKTLNFKNNNFFNDFYLQTGLSSLSEKEYAKAYVVLKDYVSTNTSNDYAHNLAGIVSYILGNNLDAFLHVKKAIEINPTNDNYYFNLYFLNKKADNKEEALKNISSAIQLNNDQPEYYSFRADLYMEKKYWSEAVSDLNKVISSDRNISFYTYFQRGICKMWLKDGTGCQDFQKAYGMTDNQDWKKKIQEWYNNNRCR